MKRDPRLFYFVCLGAVFGLVAWWRLDLVMEAARATTAALSRGGPARWKVSSEMALFGLILLGCARGIADSPDPRRDARVLAFGLAAGWVAEAWGTRLGLWSYYTGEKPPLWIVPAWPLGAALIARAAEVARRAAGPAPSYAYWAAAAAVVAVCTAFSSPALTHPYGWLGPAAILSILAWAPCPAEDFWVLAAGAACVFFADLWGTTNGCWAYYLRARPLGLWRGIAFGMAFDTTIVLGCLKLARRF